MFKKFMWLGKLVMTAVAIIAGGGACLLVWAAVVADSNGQQEAAVASLSLSVGAGSMAGGLLAALWTKYV